MSSRLMCFTKHQFPLFNNKFCWVKRECLVRCYGKEMKVKLTSMGHITTCFSAIGIPPSKHTFNDSRYDMELHLVHQSFDGKIAATGIVYKYGRPDYFLSKLLHHIKSPGKEEKELGIVNPGDIKLRIKIYYRYIGSLTVPPSKESVIVA